MCFSMVSTFLLRALLSKAALLWERGRCWRPGWSPLTAAVVSSVIYLPVLLMYTCLSGPSSAATIPKGSFCSARKWVCQSVLSWPPKTDSSSSLQKLRSLLLHIQARGWVRAGQELVAFWWNVKKGGSFCFCFISC